MIDGIDTPVLLTLAAILVIWALKIIGNLLTGKSLFHGFDSQKPPSHFNNHEESLFRGCDDLSECRPYSPLADEGSPLADKYDD